MHTIEIPESGLTLYMPSDLSECDDRQYIEMSELIFRFQNGYLPYDEMKIQAVYKLLNLKAVPSFWESDEEDKLSNIYLISELVDNFFEINEEGVKILKQFYVNNPVPSIKPIFTRYFGPSDGFMNITFGEYTDALRLFHDFYATGEIKLIYLLTAIFYREKTSFHFFKKKSNNYNGDIRRAYNSNLIEKRADKFKDAPFGFIYGTFLLFASFQKYLVEAKIQWGGQELDLSILFDNKNSDSAPSVIPGIGMDAIAFTLAESGAFGSLEKVRATNFWQIIVRMYDLQKTNLEQKQRENAASK